MEGRQLVLFWNSLGLRGESQGITRPEVLKIELETLKDPDFHCSSKTCSVPLSKYFLGEDNFDSEQRVTCIDVSYSIAENTIKLKNIEYAMIQDYSVKYSATIKMILLNTS